MAFFIRGRFVIVSKKVSGSKIGKAGCGLVAKKLLLILSGFSFLESTKFLSPGTGNFNDGEYKRPEIFMRTGDGGIQPRTRT